MYGLQPIIYNGCLVHSIRKRDAMQKERKKSGENSVKGTLYYYFPWELDFCTTFPIMEYISNGKIAQKWVSDA